jgi:SAM-dependent methyltransferase
VSGNSEETGVNQNGCPCCGSGESDTLYPAWRGPCVTSDMEALAHASLDNRLCRGCGLVFNAGGTRGASRDFYRDAYKLMARDPRASIQNFAGGQPMSQALRTLQILEELVALPKAGRILEAGAGKGEFLGHFAERFPAWSLRAFEPSAAFDTLARAFPGASLTRGEYSAIDLRGEADLVVALGVLEHVENPLHMLRWGMRQLREGGIFYLRVPNFAANPNDLFCADHLSKLTEPTLRALARAAGFEWIASRQAGVPIFVALQKSGGEHALGNAYAENAPLAERNVETGRRALEAVLRCRERARALSEAFAIFGLGPSGLFAPFFGGFEPAEIAAYLDENATVWGSRIHGRPVGGLDLIEDLRIRHVALAISPVYFDQVRAKLAPHGVEVFAA